jgi:ankyrin repeat protein
LVNSNVDVDEYDGFGKTALIHAVQNSNSAMVAGLLNLKATPYLTDRLGNTPLLLACRKGNLEIVNFLLHSNAFPNTSNFFLITPLMSAAQKGHTEIVKVLLRTPGTEVNSMTKNNSNALFFAVDYNYPKVVRILLKAGAVNPKGKDAVRAAVRRDVRVLKQLIQFKFDLNIRSSEGITPIMAASRTRRYSAVRELLFASAQIPSKNDPILRTGLYCLAPQILRRNDVNIQNAHNKKINEILNDFSSLNNQNDVHRFFEFTSNIPGSLVEGLPYSVHEAASIVFTIRDFKQSGRKRLFSVLDR